MIPELAYIDPGTGGAIFQGLGTLIAALGGTAACAAAFLLKPVRSFVRRLVGGKERIEDSEEDTHEPPRRSR